MAKRNNLRNLQLNKPGLFTPTVVRGIRQGPPAQSVNFKRVTNTLEQSDIGSTNSFKYSIEGDGLVSTQQINVDYGKFENHTFFNSAQVKTNVAFDIIFNSFPFDGTKQELEAFFEGLTGFEKHTYNQFPKNTGYLWFQSGSQETYIRTKDIAGAAFPSISRITFGESVLSPGTKPMTIEMQLFIPTGSNENSAILDKHLSGSSSTIQNGFYLALNSTSSTTTGSVSFFITSGSVHDEVAIEMEKGKFNHIAFVWDRTPGINTISGYVNQNFFASSSQPIEFENIDAAAPDLLIGSGSALGALFVPTTSFSGAIDELRIWSTVRSANQRKQFKEKAVFAQDGLSLYYKFNEPSGSNSPVVLDHSGHALHGRLSTGAILLKVRELPTGSTAGSSAMTYEKIADSPILFPGHLDVLSLQSTMLLSASNYDQANPNLITKLIPVHYLLEGQAEDGLESETGAIAEAVQSGTDPRSINLGATQALLLLLYTWAKFFDEMKLYVQALSTLRAVDYDIEDTVPDQFLLDLAKNEGIDLPPLFEGASIEQWVEAENILSDISTNDLTLQTIRNQIWRRILINLQDVVKSKGTIHAVKSFIRAVGVDPDNNFRIREYGGPTNRPLTFVREKRSEISTLLDFISGSYPFLQSPFLTAERVEPGFPQPAGSASDQLLTSGSWTFEGLYRFVPQTSQPQSQSLARLIVKGSDGYGFSPVANVVHVKAGNTTLFVRPSLSGSTNTLSLAITGADLFDGNTWYISFGRQRADEINSITSASYFLRVAKQNFGEITEQYTTSSFFDEAQSGNVDDIVWSNFATVFTSSNTSGSFIQIGSQSLSANPTDIHLSPGGSTVPPTALTTDFRGRVGHIRFWSKTLLDKEWPEHVRYFRSVGVQEPRTHFNFTVTPTGSWERLRLDASTDQPVTQSNASGNIFITDFTQNGYTLTGSKFAFTSPVIVPERFFFSYLSPKFDEAATTEKVRIRSFERFENVQETPWAQVAPAYDIERSELPTDSTRFTIDFSVVDALNQDIVTIFSTLDALDNILGNPELLYSPDYPGLEDLRNIYFNKLTDKLNLRLFFDFFKWFDVNIGTFVSQLLPRKTRFLGTNFVVESHMLERAKLEYFSSDIYLGDNNRHGLKDTILLRLIVGSIGRY